MASDVKKISEQSFFGIIRPQLKTVFRYSLGYMIAILYYEVLLAFQYGIGDMSLYFILFIPAQATCLALLNGWFKKKLINRIMYPIGMGILCVYYESQLIYYTIFDSMYSVYLIGQGAQAAGKFSDGLFEKIMGAMIWIILFLLPLIFAILYAYASSEKGAPKFTKIKRLWGKIKSLIGLKGKKPSRAKRLVKYVWEYVTPKKRFVKYSVGVHVIGAMQMVALWCLAVLLMIPFGTGRSSAFEAYSSATTSTEIGYRRLGVLTNFLLELRGAEIEDISLQSSEDSANIGGDLGVTTQYAPNIISKIDFASLSNLTVDKEKKDLCSYFANVHPTYKNEYTGKLKDYNLIYICAESFSTYAIDKELTPTLYQLSQGGIVLNNYYNSFKNTTTNGEFAFLTGLWPDVSRVANMGTDVGSFPQSRNNAFPFSLANSFKAEGAKTFAYHNFLGSYYSRRASHTNLGYDVLRFMDGTNHMRFSNSWPSSDLEMIQQSVDDYINEPRFHAYYMTFSGHGPYSSSNNIANGNIDYVRKVVKERDLPYDAEYYLAANYELEKAMAELMKKLEAAGKLNNTLIVLTGDHYPYYLGSKTYNALAGEEIDTTFGIYKSTCIMWCGGMEPVQVDVPCSNVDIMPTVLNLLGMEYDSRLLPGVDIFSSSPHLAILSDTDTFVTDMVKYDALRDKAEWLPASESMTDEEKEQYIVDRLEYIKLKKNASIMLMKEDFYRFVFDNTQ